MGGDFGPPVTVPAAMRALAFYPHLNIVLIGDTQQIKQHIPESSPELSRLTIKHASQIVTMHDRPLTALRNRRDSSMRLALDLVKDGEADACISSGNTGVLMAMAKLVLKTLPGIDRPALTSRLPTLDDQPVYMLDLGANVSCDSETLFQFAVMGSVMAETVEQLERPKVALLNIGEESIKGNDVVRQTAELLRQTQKLNYTGFIEGHQIFSGRAQVIVCDGFVGNITLKTTEGVAHLLISYLKQTISNTWLLKLLFLVLRPLFKNTFKKMKPDQYNGASLLGLRGIVVKSHGNADQEAFFNAIQQAVVEVEQQVPSRIQHRLESVLLEKVC